MYKRQDYNFTQQPGDAWFTTILMDVWHWTSLVVLLSYAGLNSIQPAYYQAAEIDGASRWATFRYIELPKMKKVLTLAILLIQIPLGIGIALTMPKKGWGVPVCLILMSMPLLIPWNVVGAMWNIFALPDIGFLGHSLNGLGFDYNFTQQPGDAWFTTILMDVWHWTSLVVLLSYAGLNSIQPAYYQAAEIDGASRWDIFRYIELPKMKKVLTLAIPVSYTHLTLPTIYSV